MNGDQIFVLGLFALCLVLFIYIFYLVCVAGSTGELQRAIAGAVIELRDEDD